MRGYFGIGIENGKTEANLGTLWRSADIFGAAFIFTIGRRYRQQPSDTSKAFRGIPLYSYNTFEDFYSTLPFCCQLVGIELIESATPLCEYKHPDRAIYLLGAEDSGLTKKALNRCHTCLVLPGSWSMNVATAGSIVMYDRHTKRVPE